LCGIRTAGDSSQAGRWRAGVERGRRGGPGRAETAERIAGRAEMIVAGQGPRLGRQTQVTAVVTTLDQGDRGNYDEREGTGPSP
jgi:hypothetical protein